MHEAPRSKLTPVTCTSLFKSSQLHYVKEYFQVTKTLQTYFIYLPQVSLKGGGGGVTLGIFWWECAAGTLEPLAHTRASSAEFWYSIAILD